jgi:GMP synthase (glutamine-hydrolysing)
MRRAIAVRHVAFEDLGSLAAVLQRCGFALAYCDATVDDLAADIVDSDLLVVLGGPIGAYEEEPYAFLSDELRAIAIRPSPGSTMPWRCSSISKSPPPGSSAGISALPARSC